MAHRFVSVDFETRSATDLPKVGVYTYAEHDTTDVLCMAYSFDEAPDDVKLWIKGQAFPADLKTAIVDGAYLRAWNANFERTIWRLCCEPKYGWPAVAEDRWVCTMALALASGLPGKLESAAIVLGAAQQKDAAGHRLMLQVSKPRTRDPLTWWDDDDRLHRLYEYCRQDVRTEDSIWALLPPAMDRRERLLWLLDQRINDRGVRLDLTLIRTAASMAEQELARLDGRMSDLTSGKVTNATKVMDLKRWVEGKQGIVVPSLDKASVATLLLDDSLYLDVREALEIRQEAGKSSVAKYLTMLDCVGQGDRARGMLQYYGAGTGRWAGRLIQMQNFPKGNLHPDDLPHTIAWVKQGERLNVSLVYGRVLDVLSSLLRSCLVPSEGRVFDVADYSSIEARVVAWLAGQEDLVDLFAGGGKVYHALAAEVFGIPVESITKSMPEYAVGKMGILGCGFGMGKVKFAAQAKIDEALADRVVQSYRRLYPKIVALWANMDATALDVVTRGVTGWQPVPGTQDRVAFRVFGGYLCMRLPSGRALWYHGPRIVERLTPWGAIRPSVQIRALDSTTRQWNAVDLYGGLLTENAVQAIARDIMADAMLRVDATPGHETVLTVHDELVVESDPTTSHTALEEMLTQTPTWAVGCPISAEGWRGDRYRK